MDAQADRAPALSRGRTALVAAGMLATAALIAVVVLVAEPLRIPSGSMAPTLQAGDSVVVDKLAYRDAGPRRGELVVFRAPRTDEVLLKRVVAVAGEEVGIEDGVLVVNGRRRAEAYADPENIDGVFFGPRRVGRGTVFLLGDNRRESEDSRDFGAVPTDDLIGRVTVRIWPPARWGNPH